MVPPCTWYMGPVPVRVHARPSTPGELGQGCHCPLPRSVVMSCIRRPAIAPGQHPGASVTELDRDIRSRKVRSLDLGPAHEPNNRFFGQQAWWSVGTAALIDLFSFSGQNALRYRGAFSRPPPGSGGAARAFRGRARPTEDATAVKVAADHPCGCREIRVARDGASQPVDVRRLEGRDLAERVAVELPEFDRVGGRAVERGWRRPPEVADPALHRRPGRRRRSRRLAIHHERHGAAVARQAAPDATGFRRPGCAAGTSRSCRGGP